MGNRIRQKREEINMTQEQLAERSGVSRATISALENGVERNTTSKTLIAIASAMGATVDDIFFIENV